MLGYVLMGPDEATVERLKNRPSVRMLCVLLSSHVYCNLGLEPPLQTDSGWHGFIPNEVPREESMRIIEAIPPKIVDYYVFCGTPEQVAEEVATVPRRGPPSPRHVEHHGTRWSGPRRLLVPGHETTEGNPGGKLMAEVDNRGRDRAVHCRHKQRELGRTRRVVA
jgi:hypothetical protein